MVALPKIDDLDLSGKKVFVRGDLDIEIPNANSQFPINTNTSLRLQVLKSTIDKIFEKGAVRVMLAGHRGRPKAAESLQSTADSNKELSMKDLAPVLGEILGREVIFSEKIVGPEVNQLTRLPDGQVNDSENQSIILLENLRFDGREEENDEGFAKEVASLADVYVNEAFAVSHREHASIVGVPKFLVHVAGLRLSKEIEALNVILTSPRKPVVSVISGVKEDKLAYIEGFTKFSDKILVAGRLPDFINQGISNFPASPAGRQFPISNDGKIVVANLVPDKEDITIHSIEKFESEIAAAKTLVLAGPIGKFEEEGHRLGTTRVFTAIVNNTDAFKLAGGGDTEKALQVLGLGDKFDWVSVGGGAMLEFLAKGTLPGIEALLN